MPRGKPSVRIRNIAISRPIVSGTSRRTSDQEVVAVWQLKPQSAQTHNDSAGRSYSPRAAITTECCSPMGSRAGGYEAFLVRPRPCWRTGDRRRQGHRRAEAGGAVGYVGSLGAVRAVVAVCAGGLVVVVGGRNGKGDCDRRTGRMGSQSPRPRTGHKHRGRAGRAHGTRTRRRTGRWSWQTGPATRSGMGRGRTGPGT